MVPQGGTVNISPRFIYRVHKTVEIVPFLHNLCHFYIIYCVLSNTLSLTFFIKNMSQKSFCVIHAAVSSCIMCGNVDVVQFIQLFPYLKTFKLFLIFYYCKQGCNKHPCTCPLGISTSVSLGWVHRRGIANEQLSKGTVPIFSLCSHVTHSLGEFQREFNKSTVDNSATPQSWQQWGCSYSQA